MGEEDWGAGGLLRGGRSPAGGWRRGPQGEGLLSSGFLPPSCPWGPRHGGRVPWPGQCSAVRVAWRLRHFCTIGHHTSPLRLRLQQVVGGAGPTRGAEGGNA